MEKIIVLAHRMAIRHTPENELPVNLRSDYKSQSSDEKKKQRKKLNFNSIENKNLRDRTRNIEILLNELSSVIGIEEMVRVASINPIIEPGITSVVYCKDFINLTDYFSAYRENYPENKFAIGTLSMMLGDLQKHIELKIGKLDIPPPNITNKPTKQVILKDPDAQLLFDFGEAEIDGVKINLWKGHTQSTIRAQEGWNKVKSYSELNEKSSGFSGHVVFSGIMQIPRNEAQNYAIQMGFKVHSDVSKTTDFFIVGSENVSPLDTNRVLKLREKGVIVKVISEIDFLELVIDQLQL